MALETASYVANLVVTNPDGGDQRSTADDHIRLLKASLRRTFPNLDGAVSLSAAQVMYLGDVSASVQLQFNQLRDGTATANNAINSRFAISASEAVRCVSADYATYATYATSAGNAATADNAVNATSAGSASTASTATVAASANALQGYAPSTGAAGSTVALRTPEGYLLATYHYQSSLENENPSIASLIVSSGDGYFRKATLAFAQTFLTTRNISGKTGVSKTLSASAPSGGADGDVWYTY